MGNESSVLENCEWGDSVCDKSWIITQGTLVDGSEISLFSLRKNEKKQADQLRTLIKQLRTIRHPCILHYMFNDESVDGPRLMTERVVPIEIMLPTLSAIEICAGLQNVLEGLAFLHDQACVCHNNVHIGSVYVSGDGSWRLAGLEYAKHFSAITTEFLETTRASRNEAAITPEEQEGKLTLTPDVGHARDVYALAVMVESFIDKLEDLGDLTKTFELRIQDECLHSNPKQRPKVKSLLSDRLFTTEFLQIATFLKNIILKTDEEREVFFKDLLPKLLKLPGDLIGKRLVPCLLSRFVMLDAHAVDNVIPSLLTPCPDELEKSDSVDRGPVIPLLNRQTYQHYVVPKLVKMFNVHDLHIRVLLLTYFPDYVALISKDTLENEIFPQVLLGLRDTSNTIAALSLHALAEMVHILGRDVVIGGRSKTYFKEGMPKKPGELPSGANCHIKVTDSVNNQCRNANVHSVMERTKLKDLAILSENHLKKTEEDKERKWKEKEKKREEMKKKREERKLEREKNKKLSTTEDDAVHVSSEPHIGDIHSNVQDSINQSDHLILETVQSDDSFQINSSQKNDDWSDWEDEKRENTNGIYTEDNTLAQVMDNESDLSDEIERELESVDAPVTKQKTQDFENKTKDFSKKSVAKMTENVENKSAEMSVASTRSGKKLQLKTSKKSKSPNSAVLNSHRDKKITKDSVTTQFQHSPVHPGSNSVPSSEKTQSIQKPTTRTKTEPLGAHFDIKSVDIKVIPQSQDPFDFFADMAPKIEVKPSALLPEPQSHDDVEQRGSGEKIEAKSTLTFAMANTEDTEAGDGWGEEDW